ncbi:hypothetical protein J21TS3_45620 [Paenibacillus cookii]|uniref:Uncharacterized protein n=1 Tax=Paenibacillus cookii TaxID=157839 RepID=A0ABQ4M2H7_9BACL|nr:hypothetical protein CM49_01728 [Paenibacillus sp. P1XP2]GIO69741.1 hypothetical protein J21TS3_45620 [Paenibacillus cookii]
MLKLVKAGDEAAGRISLYFIHKAIERKTGPALCCKIQIGIAQTKHMRLKKYQSPGQECPGLLWYMNTLCGYGMATPGRRPATSSMEGPGFPLT